MKNRYLMHHGILGQKWGVRRFQDKKGRLTSAGKERYGKEGKEKEESGDKEKFWTDERKNLAKKAAIGAAVIGGIALGSYALYKSGALNKILDKSVETGENAVKNLLGNTNQTTFGDDPADLDTYSDAVKEAYFKAKDAAAKVNPTGSNKNCGPCSILLHVNERLNKNYKATPDAMSDYDGLSKFFKGFDKYTNTVHVDKTGFMTDDIKEAYSDMIEYMTSFGDGAGGVCSGHWDKSTGRNGGHFLSWKVTDGTVIFSDGQDGTVYLKDAFDYVFKDMDRTTLAFSRLDQLEIIEDGIKDIVYNELKKGDLG